MCYYLGCFIIDSYSFCSFQYETRIPKEKLFGKYKIFSARKKIKISQKVYNSTTKRKIMITIAFR